MLLPLHVYVVFQKKLLPISFLTATDMLLFVMICSTTLLICLHGARWSKASKGTRLKWFFNGLPDITFEDNVNLFSIVQKFIIDSGRFARSGS